NRIWAQHFGQGMVRTLGDFGSQGDFPSHPELLDWLAAEFVASGWDVKALHRTILNSATYRQSSVTRPEYAEKDPYNRLVHRMGRFRLDAEEIRDNALEVAGLLSPRIGGPSVMPYQPADFYKGKNEGWPWQVAAGDDLYRRGMYTFWRRTSPYPTFAIFDAPSREECATARARTNTPLQALAALNDPAFVEAARVLAERVMTEGKNSDERLLLLFRKATARKPTSQEFAVLAGIYERQRKTFAADAKAAQALVKTGNYRPAKGLDVAEHAAWAAVANVVLNLDETITRE
ncbi:MAG TPA: DUF1553 domain-containing protein, partial [Planctomycetia bacterium]|nr:DUF1553 domain-containing protein [Planctomycetia bacterium]